MERVDILSLPQVTSDSQCFKVAMSYKNYCSIRRDLRKVNTICEYVIDLHQKILDDPQALSNVAKTLFLVTGALMHAVVLYGRWFKATRGKPTLDPKTFFTDGSDGRQVHDRLVSLRDRYVAHNELDTLGSDNIWAYFSQAGQFEKVESDWVEQVFIWHEDVDTKSFRNCILVVHNKIDAEILPEIERKLNEHLRKIHM